MPRSHDRAMRDRRRQMKFEKQGGLCWWCRAPMTLSLNSNGMPGKRFATFEHLVRRADGGVGLPNNVVLACRVCNNERDHDARPVEGLGWSLEAMS